MILCWRTPGRSSEEREDGEFYLDDLLDGVEPRRLEADRSRAELDHQYARREIDRVWQA